MLSSTDLIPKDFNYKKYISDFDLVNLINASRDTLPEDFTKKIIYDQKFSVDPNNKSPYPYELDDLSRLHYIACSRKVTTILEFGMGVSTIILGDSLSINKKKHHAYTSSNLRRDNLYECHSIDNYKFWLENTRKNIPNHLLSGKFVNLHLSKLISSDFSGRYCTYYDPIINICPDLIYLDGPDQFSSIGEIRGFSTRHQDRMPMAADILAFEHFLQPGTLIILDGRTANARFLKCNLQRNWAYYFAKDWDQHFFELQEEPLGVYNERMLNHCLGDDYFKRIKD